MAKGKGKRPSEMKEEIAEGETKNDSAGSAPKLDESAFAGLRQTIEQRLKNENESKQQKENKKKNNTGGKNPNKNSTNDAKSAKDKSKDNKHTPVVKQDTNKGKKRGNDGEVIPKREENDRVKIQPRDGDENDILHKEILALGGTHEDFDLLANVDSEEEIDVSADVSTNPKNKTEESSIRNELSKILQQAGHVAPDDIESESDEKSGSDEESEHDEESNSEEGESDQDSPPPPAPKGEGEEPKKKKASKESSTEPEPILPKAFAKLVSAFLSL